MPRIETQGLSEDYRTATGSFDSLDRGDLSTAELLDILRLIAPLRTPDEAENCPPTVNTMLMKGSYTCFYGDGGVIRCTDSRQEEMTPEEAVKIMSGEMSIEEFDISKGFKPRSNGIKWIGLLSIIAVVFAGILTIV